MPLLSPWAQLRGTLVVAVTPQLPVRPLLPRLVLPILVVIRGMVSPRAKSCLSRIIIPHREPCRAISETLEHES
jgi:hypothetical protein